MGSQVDVGANQKIAKIFDINTTVLSRQLPTLILFKNFEEVRRFPPITPDGEIPKVLNYDGEQIERYFEFRRVRILNVLQKRQWQIEGATPK